MKINDQAILLTDIVTNVGNDSGIRKKYQTCRKLYGPGFVYLHFVSIREAFLAHATKVTAWFISVQLFQSMFSRVKTQILESLENCPDNAMVCAGGIMDNDTVSCWTIFETFPLNTAPSSHSCSSKYALKLPSQATSLIRCVCCSVRRGNSVKPCARCKIANVCTECMTEHIHECEKVQELRKLSERQLLEVIRESWKTFPTSNYFFPTKTETVSEITVSHITDAMLETVSDLGGGACFGNSSRPHYLISNKILRSLSGQYVGKDASVPWVKTLDLLAEFFSTSMDGTMENILKSISPETKAVFFYPNIDSFYSRLEADRVKPTYVPLNKELDPVHPDLKLVQLILQSPFGLFTRYIHVFHSVT